MMPLGPQLIGQTEKALNALLIPLLERRGMTEPEWVTLRLAAQFEGDAGLAEFVADRARFSDAPRLVAGLRERGLLEASPRDGQWLTERARALVAEITADITALTGPVFADLADAEVAARVPAMVLERARAVLGAGERAYADPGQQELSSGR